MSFNATYTEPDAGSKKVNKSSQFSEWDLFRERGQFPTEVVLTGHLMNNDTSKKCDSYNSNI